MFLFIEVLNLDILLVTIPPSTSIFSLSFKLNFAAFTLLLIGKYIILFLFPNTSG